MQLNIDIGNTRYICERRAKALFMMRIAQDSDPNWRYHLIGYIDETQQPREYLSLCGQVRGNWQGIQVSEVPFIVYFCKSCARLGVKNGLLKQEEGALAA